MDKLKMQSANRTQDAISEIEKLFPHVITEVEAGLERDALGNVKPKFKKAIDFDLLRQTLSDEIVEDDTERYRLDWPGKKASLLKANTPITKTLRPAPTESVDWNKTENLYVEGDNLEVLKILQESYLGKVKMIYIDPPYNTGNDFIYKDNFKKSRESYEEEIGVTDESGEKLFRNTDSNGRFHSDWLSMMYERLLVARDFLREDGVIFISIDDNEVHNLRKICDEIFGEENFVATFSWKSRTAKADVPFGVSNDVEWLVSYSKSSLFMAGRLGSRKYFKSDDYKDRWRIQDLTTNKTMQERPNSYFKIINPKNGDAFSASKLRTWAVTNDTFNDYYERGKIVFPEDYPFLKIKQPVFRVFESEDKQKQLSKYGTEEVRMSVSSSMDETLIGRNEDGTKELRSIFNGQLFSYPKPTNLVKYLLYILCDNQSLILDFFSGSATTAHAVMQLNAEDGGNRKFILVQLPEKTDENSEAYKAGFTTIAEIGKERIRRAAKKIRETATTKNTKGTKKETNKKSSKEDVLFEEDLETKDGEVIVVDPEKLDLGFRVFKVDESSMKDVFYNPADLSQDSLYDLRDNIKEDRSEQDILTQVMLDLGLILSLPIEEKKFGVNKLYFVDTNALVACFDPKMDFAIVDEIAKVAPLRVVFRDACFSDDKDRINVEERFKRLSTSTKVMVI